MLGLVITLAILFTMSACFAQGHGALLFAVVMLGAFVGELGQACEEGRAPMLVPAVCSACFAVWAILALVGMHLGALDNWPIR